MRILKFLITCLLLSTGSFAAQLRQVALLDLPGEPGFDAVAIANGSLIVAHPVANTVDIFDLAKRRMIAQVKNVHGAGGIAVDEHNQRVFISSPETGTIVVISAKTWDVQSVIPVKAAAERIVYAPVNDRLYLADSRGESVGYVDFAHGNAVRMQDAGGMPERIAFDPGRNQIFATLQDKHAVGVYDLDLKPLAQWVLKASQPAGLVVDGEARKLYVAVRHAVVALNADTGDEINRAGAPVGVDSLWLDRPSTTLYAASGGAITILKTSPTGLARESELNVDVRGHTLAYDPETKLIYLPGARDGRSKLLILKRVTGQEPLLAGKSPAQTIGK